MTVEGLTLEEIVRAIKAVHPRWTITDYGLSQGVTDEWLGIIPLFLDMNDPRPAAEQINDEYAHGGGWRTMDGFTMEPDHTLTYPSGVDHPEERYVPLATATLRDEQLFFYDCAWVAIVQPDGTFEVARLD